MIKAAEMTYMHDGRVYKWFADESRCIMRVQRAKVLAPHCPIIEYNNSNVFWYNAVPGVELSTCLDKLPEFLNWLVTDLWPSERYDSPVVCLDWVLRFYRDKTLARIEKRFNRATEDVEHWVRSRNWASIAKYIHLSERWHGDCSFENVICTKNGFKIIDWREDAVGDLQYDVVKMLKSCQFDHRTLRPHRNADKLTKIIVNWWSDDLHDLVALHWFSMSGAHAGELSDWLFQRGKDMIHGC